MTRRLLTALATAFILYGVVGARLGQAQQATGPGASAPAEDSSPPPADPDGDVPPPVGDAPPLPSGGARPRAVPPGKAAPSLPADPEPTPPASGGERPAAGADPFGPETGGTAAEAKADDLTRTQAPPVDGGGLPPAKEPQGGAPAGSAPPPGDPRILPADRLPLGPSTAALTVEVQGPPNANLNRPVKFKIFVKNSGSAPAMGVMVHDPMPDGLEFVKSEPPPSDRIGPILQWQLDSLSAGAEKVINVTAIPRKVGDFDHAPTVSLRTGSRSRTMVKHPKLKVELTHEESGNVLIKRPVNFAVRVTNNGSGPARGVVLHANLTGGLKHEAGQTLEVNFKEYLGRDVLNPGESEAIPLEVEAVAGGDQLCKVTVDSPDVEDSPEAHAESKVTVVEPKLVLDLKGSSERYTDTLATYTLTVTNPGTATARNVVAGAWLPALSGQLDKVPPETQFTAKDRRLFWPVGDLEPGKSKSLTFHVQLGGVGLFKVDASAKADGIAKEDTSFSTHVTGMPDIKCVVVARTRVLDVGEETTYEVRLSNVGSKEATNLSVKAVLTPNLRVEETSGTDQKAKSTTAERTDALFPAINLAPQASQSLSLRVKAMKSGPAKCTVTVIYDESVTEYSTSTKVTDPR